MDYAALRAQAQAARETADAATPKPWVHVRGRGVHSVRSVSATIAEEVVPLAGGESNLELAPNAAFIAHAREDVPALADAVLALTARCEALEAADMASVVRLADRKQTEALERLRRHGFVFTRAPSEAVQHPETLSDGERWEHMAFALYSDLVELAIAARAALADLDRGEEAS